LRRRTTAPIRQFRIPLSMLAVWQLLDTVLGLYTFVVVISVVLTWMVQFNVVNTSNQFVYMVGDFLYRVTEPLLKRIRSVVPPIGGMDLSPLILLLALFFVRSLIRNNLILG
jgi:YggT family protein